MLSKATFMITEYSPVTLLHSKMFRVVIEFLLVLRKHVEVDEGEDVISKLHRIDLCLVGCDDSIFFQFFNSC